ncbi:MAG: hypothetical protein HY673_13970 [Chloroflexi bacterium]|nr:hypothetical protein [Chloroflexota bacterium]
MIRPKEEREEIAIGRFLEYYNKANGTSYEIEKCEWLDRLPRRGHEGQRPTPDCLCRDGVNGTEMVIERTMLTGEQDLKLTQGAESFLADVRDQLACKLPGVFLLHDWGVNAITYTTKNRGKKINQLCEAVLAAAPMLPEGEEVQLEIPFPVKLKKEEPHKVKTDCALIPFPPDCSTDKNQPDQQLVRVLDEGNKKFAAYSGAETVLLANIWETGLTYELFKKECFEKVTMEEYPDIKHIYLSGGSPDPLIYHLWSRSREKCDP